jgi:hypothetical protein
MFMACVPSPQWPMGAAAKRIRHGPNQQTRAIGSVRF